MANSDAILSALTADVINQAIDIARAKQPSAIGTIQQAAAERPEDGYKLKWINAYRDKLGVNLAAAVANGTDTTITLPSGHGIRAGMTLLVEDANNEALFVTAVTATTATVVRNHGSLVTPAAISSGTRLSIESVAREENSLAVEDNIFQGEAGENFFQTMDFTINLSRRMQAQAVHGDFNDLQFQVSEQLVEQVLRLDRMLLRGVKGVVGSGASAISTAGGMRFYAAQSGGLNIDNSGAALTLDKLNDVYEQMFNRGGMPDSVVCSTKYARLLNNAISGKFNSQRLNDYINDKGAITRLPSDLPVFGGVTNIIVDNTMRGNELFMYDSSKIELVPMAAGLGQDSGAWRTLDATQKGQDGQSVRVIGDMSFRFRNPNACLARLHNLA